nr:LacI family DNA-binding transcriptional regulator [Streptomyces marokkonensis]
MAGTAGTSVPTVSKVLRGGADVSAETREGPREGVSGLRHPTAEPETVEHRHRRGHGRGNRRLDALREAA